VSQHIYCYIAKPRLSSQMTIIPEGIKSRDVFAIMVVIILLFSPFIPPKTPYELAAIFVGKPPSGNNTVAIETLLSTKSVPVTIYLIHKWPWYIFVQALGAGEFLLLYLKIRAIRPESSWSYSSVLDHGGACLANTEFWVFMTFHHILLCFFALNTASLFGVVSIVVAYVICLALVCEPNDDCGRQSSQQELYTNRVVLITVALVLTLYLFSRDEQIHGNTDPDNDVWSILAIQLVLDGALIFAHCSINAQLLFAYVARLMYVTTCNIVMVVWFVV
jgi:hypothetical protein